MEPNTPGSGIDAILDGNYDPEVIEQAKVETLQAVSSYNDDYARSILKARDRFAHTWLAPVPAIPSIRRSTFEAQGVIHGYNRPLNDEWHAPDRTSVNPMLGLVMGPRTLETDYSTPIPAYWRRRTPLLEQHRIFWYSAYLFALNLPPGLENWSELAYVLSSTFELGVMLDYWEKLRFDRAVVDQVWQDITVGVETARRIDRLDVLWHGIYTGLVAYLNHCGDFEHHRMLELRCYELGTYVLARTFRPDHGAAMALGVVIGLGHDLLEAGTDISNREEHNFWSLLTNGCCCPTCVGALEAWLRKWLHADADTAGHQAAWCFIGYFLSTWISERHGVSPPGSAPPLTFRRCDDLSPLNQVLAAADAVAGKRVAVAEPRRCGRHTANALPVTVEDRRALHKRYTSEMFRRDGTHCDCLHRTFIQQLETHGLYQLLQPWIREVIPLPGPRPDK